MTFLMLTALAVVGAQQPLPDELRLMRFPTVYGDQVTFTYAGDLWTCSLKGGQARRLTSFPGFESRPRYSPDGKWIAFTGAYDGNSDVFVIPSEGGDPKRLTFEPESDNVIGWTPDGKVAYVSANGSITNRQARLWLVDPKQSGMPISTKLEEVSDGSFSPDGKQIVYNRVNSHQFNWRRYRGGTQGRISFYDFAQNKYWELPAERENSWFPMWVGNKVYFASDRAKGTVNLYEASVDTKRVTALTDYSDEDIKWPSTDGKTIVFERDGFLYGYDIASKKTSKISPTIAGDLNSARPSLQNLASSISALSLSPSGSRLAVEARGEIFSVPAMSGETRNLLSTPNSRERWPSWSPDGKMIAYVSDASGEYDVWMVPQMGGEPVRLTARRDSTIEGIEWTPDSKAIIYNTRDNDLVWVDVTTKQETLIHHDKFGLSSFDVSPDSKWVAFLETADNLFGRLCLYDVESKKKTVVNEGYYRDDSVAFDLNGKFLYIISARTYTPTPGDFEFLLNFTNSQRVYVMLLSKDQPNPLLPPPDEEGAGAGTPKESPAPSAQKVEVKVDLDGLAQRLLPLPMPAGNYGAIIGGMKSVFFVSEGKLMQYTVGERGGPQEILSGFQGLTFNPSRSKLAYIAPGGVVGISAVRPGITIGTGRVNLSGVETIINPLAEWKQMYWEAWRYMRDNYYDAKMLGLDWKAIGDHYAKYLPSVRNRADLNYLFGLLIGEMGTGHSYVQGGDMGPMPAPIPVGKLGADYDTDGKGVRFAKIYRGLNFEEGRRGPLGDPGVDVKEGDYLIAIDGVNVGTTHNVHELLQNKVGRTVVLTVNDKPSADGARQVRVRPISSETQLRYIEWVEGNRRYVEKATGGKIGYLHIPDTSVPGMSEFIKGYLGQSDKQALILDERFNGGGMIPTFFIERMQRAVDTAMRPRHGSDINFPTSTFRGPSVMLINQYAGSGGDMLPWLYKNAKVGPLIGMRTWGGLVGIRGFTQLADGGGITAPEFGIFHLTDGRWIAENTGVDPDIEVDARPDLLAEGKDPQLDKAIEVLMAELKKRKDEDKRPTGFPIPKIGGGGLVPSHR